MAKAAVFCVSNSAELQLALTTAGSNGQDDVIKIVQNTYTGNFVYASHEAYDLTIEGGYTTDCSSRLVDPANTILDGGAAGTVLVLLSYNANADFKVKGITIKNAKGDYSGGLYASGKITLTNCIITNNHVYIGDSYGEVKIKWIWSEPETFCGKKVLIRGAYLGWKGEVENPRITRSDWAVEDDTGAIYVTGLPADGLNPIRDIGYSLEILGTVEVNPNGIPYIRAERVIIKK